MSDILHYVKTYGLATLDVLIVAFIIYNVYTMLVGTRAMPIAKGIVILGLAYFIGRVLQLNAFLWIFERAFEVAAIALVVIFQDELRRIVMKLGENISLHTALQKTDLENTFSSLTHSVYHLAGKSIGALIVLVQNVSLKGIVENNIHIDAVLSGELLESIFMHASPIHDGAVVIHNDRIVSAGCFLPLTERTDLNTILGTRHRAALGLTEVTDAVVIIVSEENKNVSIAHEAKLYYNVPQVRFEVMLHTIMKTKQHTQDEKPRIASRIRQNWVRFTRWFV